MAATVPLIVSIDAALVRRLRAFIASSGAYEDISEFVTSALENQFALEQSTQPQQTRDSFAAAGDLAHEVLRLPSRVRGRVATAAPTDTPLFSLTNRLFPLKIAVRVLAH